MPWLGVIGFRDAVSAAGDKGPGKVQLVELTLSSSAMLCTLEKDRVQKGGWNFTRTPEVPKLIMMPFFDLRRKGA